jgi:hypothetical protein
VFMAITAQFARSAGRLGLCRLPITLPVSAQEHLGKAPAALSPSRNARQVRCAVCCYGADIASWPPGAQTSDAVRGAPCTGFGG